MPPKAQEQHPLDVLQTILDDVLVQTAKALRASQRDFRGKPYSASGNHQSQLPDAVEKFHNALDDIDFEILRAKAVFQRDLNQLDVKDTSPPGEAALKTEQSTLPPVPVQSQTKEPLVIDLESSPAAVPPAAPLQATEAKPVPAETIAPFPDMGPVKSEAVSPMKVNKSPTPKPASTASPVKKASDLKEEAMSQAPQLPPPSAPVAPMPDMGAPTMNGAPKASMDDGGFSFTDLHFTLDPTANDLQQAAAAFAGNGNTKRLSVSNQDNNNANNSDTTGGGNQHVNQKNTSADQGNDGFQGTADDPADGMDFDFGLGDDEFNNYMDSRSGNMQLDENDFNAAYFDIDATDNS